MIYLKLLLVMVVVTAMLVAFANGKIEWVQGYLFASCIYLIANELRRADKRKNSEVSK